MTKKQIEKAAQQHGISITMVEIKKNKTAGEWRFEKKELPRELAQRNIAHYYETGEQLVEVERMIRKYNRQVKKLLAVLGVKYWGYRGGAGDWVYQLGAMDYSTELAFANID